MDLTQRDNTSKQLQDKFKILAVHYYENAIKFYPNYELIWLNLGSLHSETEYEKSILCYGRALALKKGNIQAYLGRIKVYSKMKNK